MPLKLLKTICHVKTFILSEKKINKIESWKILFISFVTAVKISAIDLLFYQKKIAKYFEMPLPIWSTK